MLKPEKETLAQVLAKHGHVIACPSCGTYVTMADVDSAAVQRQLLAVKRSPHAGIRRA